MVEKNRCILNCNIASCRYVIELYSVRLVFEKQEVMLPRQDLTPQGVPGVYAF